MRTTFSLRGRSVGITSRRSSVARGPETLQFSKEPGSGRSHSRRMRELLYPAISGSARLNPWAEIEAVPSWLRELVLKTRRPGWRSLASVAGFSPATCRSSRSIQKQHRRAARITAEDCSSRHSKLCPQLGKGVDHNPDWGQENRKAGDSKLL